jgi:hypothetical protein
MPAMAFATTTTGGRYTDSETGDKIPYDAVWADDFSYVTIEGRKYPTTREAVGLYVDSDGTADWDGLMRATIDLTGASDTIKNQYEYPNSRYDSEGDAIYESASIYYYDLDFAASGFGGKPLAGEYSQSEFEELLTLLSTGEYDWKTGNQVLFKIPDYIEDYSLLPSAVKKAYFVPETGEWAFNWAAKLSSIKAYEHGKTEAQTFDVATTLSFDDADADAAPLKGSIPTQTVSVVKRNATPKTARFFLDSTSSPFFTKKYMGSDEVWLEGYYDGAAHTVVCEEVPGWTVSYQIYNPKTAKYEDALAVSITDVNVDENGEETPIKVQATFKQAGRTTQYRYFNLNLNKASVSYNFDANQSVTDPTWKANVYTYTDSWEGSDGITHSVSYSVDRGDYVDNFTFEVAGSTYDTYNYLVMKPATVTVTGPSTSKSDDYEKALEKAWNAANKSAVEANKADLESFIRDFFVVKETPTQADPNTIKLTLLAKDLSFAEVKAMNAKYAKIFADFNFGEVAVVGSKATLKINAAPANTKDDDITFEGVTTKTYKANKKGKLAKNKSFKIVASADSGNKITYKATRANSKIKVSKAGKITVKKGLKKGTYKVKVKAKTAAGNGYKAAKATQVYIIKIK